MAAKKMYTQETVQEMHDWYMAMGARTLSDVARHFGVGQLGNATNVSSLFRRYNLPAKAPGKAGVPTLAAGAAEGDPYPAVLEYVGQILRWGYNAANIGGSEPDILAAIAQAAREVLAQHDPASVGFIPTLP